MGVAGSARKDPMEAAQEFAKRHGLSYPVLVDKKNEVLALYGVRAFPSNAVIGKDGKVLYLEPGFNEAGVKQAMAEAMQ